MRVMLEAERHWAIMLEAKLLDDGMQLRKLLQQEPQSRRAAGGYST
jgi:hypothetical protein